MECAAKGRESPCHGPVVRPCARCGAVAYCSLSHQISHWSDHKEECQRLEEQMLRADELNDFPFTFYEEATYMICEKKETRCSFFAQRSLHQHGMWYYECTCASSSTSNNPSRLTDYWHLPSTMCPCIAPLSLLPRELNCWEEYYKWRYIPLDSPVALLLHWPLTIYHAVQLVCLGGKPQSDNDINIHYLGPDKEISQLAVFGELKALFPHHKVNIELIGPGVPEYRDGETINMDNYAQCSDTSCRCKEENDGGIGLKTCNDGSPAVTLHLSKGLYHECFTNISKTSFPDLIIAANAGIAAYPNWAPTIEMIEHLTVPAVFTDFCEEAAHLAAKCLNSITRRELRIPIRLNPFRQPMVLEDSALNLPCYSNCFMFGI